MTRHYLEEDAGDILIVDRHGQEVARFSGDDALQSAVDWAGSHNLRLYSSISPTTLFDHQNLYFRRRPRGGRRSRIRSLQASLGNASPPVLEDLPEEDEEEE